MAFETNSEEYACEGMHSLGGSILKEEKGMVTV